MRPLTYSIAIGHYSLDARRRVYLQLQLRALGGVGLLRQRLRGFEIFDDSVGIGCWGQARRCWEAGLRYPDATHHLVLFEDLIPVPGFLDAVQNAIEAAPDAGLCFFCMRKIVHDAHAKGSAWLETTPYGGSTLLPTRLIRDFLDWERRFVRPSKKYDDTRLDIWGRARNVPYYLSVPSLLQHIASDHSVLGHPVSTFCDRTARLIYRGRDASEIDWTRGLPNPPKYPGSHTKKSDASALIPV